jgi:4-hydroxyacetophenone monooxygenase
MWTSVEGRRPFSQVDPEWEHEISVSEVNEQLRQSLLGDMRRQFADRPDLIEKLTPGYPPYAKRMLRDDGAWAETLHQANVELVTEAIVEITEQGIRTADGVEHPVDVIVYGTGFRASDFLGTIDVRGRHGVELHEVWADDPRAYLGITAPGFPNLFCLYGPNTNLVVNGSLFLFSECEIHYIMECLHLMLRDDVRALDLRPEVLDAFIQRVDEANAGMAWGIPRVSNWYKNRRGRVTQNWPLSTIEFWDRTRGPEPGHYELVR